MKHGDNSDEIEIENGSDERADAEVQEVSMGDGKMNMNMTTPEEGMLRLFLCVTIFFFLSPLGVYARTC